MLLQNAIDEFLLYVEVEKNYSQNTVIGYTLDLKSFEEFLIRQSRSLELDDMTKAVVRRFIQEKITHEQLKPRSIHRKISCLKSFCKYCVRENLTKNDFMVGIEVPKVDKKLPVYMSLNELHQLFRHLETASGRMALRNNLNSSYLPSSSNWRSMSASHSVSE